MPAVNPPERQDVDLTNANTLGIVCRAVNAFELTSGHQLDAARHWLGTMPGAFVLGGGSNVLFCEPQINAVLLMRLRGRTLVSRHDAGETVIVRAAAGENWHDFVNWTLQCGYYGLENLSLIPGSCGAAPVQNIGAYGAELADTVHCVEAIDLACGQQRRFDASACGFGYRDSLFKREPGRWLICAIELRLSTTPRLQLDYGDIRDELKSAQISSPDPLDVARAVCDIRRRKLPDPAQLGNAGSFFKNPVVPASRAVQADLADIAQWPQGEGQVKLAAAALIDRVGLKGWRLGAAGIHERHALVIVNHGGATGAEVMALAGEIQQRVSRQFDIVLEPEPVFIRNA